MAAELEVALDQDRDAALPALEGAHLLVDAAQLPAPAASAGTAADDGRAPGRGS